MDPAILLIIIFIVAPLIERLLKGGKGAQQPPEQRPQQRLPQHQPFPQRQPPQRRQEPVAGPAADEDDAAAGMLPDDLWEILTGEKRSPQLPVPHEEPEEFEEAYATEEYPEEARSLEELASLEGPSPGEWVSDMPEETSVIVPADAYVRPLPKRDVPRVVSLEELDIDDRKRHEEFHERLDSFGGPARVRRPARSAYRFRTDEDLRRAIVMSEILGTPKGLE